MAKIVFITSRFPYPLNKGDKLRAYFQVRELSRHHEVHLIAISERIPAVAEMAKLEAICKSVHIYKLPLIARGLQLLLSPLRKMPMQVAYFYSPRLHRKIKKVIRTVQPDHIHCHLIRTLEYAQDAQTIPVSIDFMDAFASGMEKRERIERNIFRKLLFRYEKQQLKRFEANAFQRASKYFVISQQDADALPGNADKEICILPNGVDFDVFYPKTTEKQFDLVFMGNLGYPPNIEAVRFLCEEIMPEVIRLHPEIRLLIAGIEAGQRIRAYQSKHITVIENFEDISDSIAMSRIMVAPMKISIGLQNKILQAMAMKVPCVVSSSSNQAINAPQNSAVIEADSVNDFADAITLLLSDSGRAQRIADTASEFVKQNYSWERQNEKFTKEIFRQ